MSQNPSEQENAYNELLSEISSIPDQITVFNSMPIEEATAEAERVGVLVKQNYAELRKTGIEEKYLDTLDKRKNAFVWSAAIVQSMTEMEKTAAMEWNARKPEGVELRRILIRTFLYAFRNDPQLLQSVQSIIKGKGNRDLLLDLLSCSKLGKSNIDLLNRINADLTLLDRAAQLYAELSDIFARMVLDTSKNKTAKMLHNKTWTYLKVAMDEIYEAGRYVFDEKDERHHLFYNDYRIRIGQSGAKAKAANYQQKTQTATELVTS